MAETSVVNARERFEKPRIKECSEKLNDFYRSLANEFGDRAALAAARNLAWEMMKTKIRLGLISKK